MMHFVIADENKDDIGYVDKTAALDFDVGSTDDFTLSVSLSLFDSEKYKSGNYVYCIGTEYGGILSDPEISTGDKTVTFTGDTFRGMLKKKVIEPSPNAAYRIVSGELNTVLNTLINEHFEGIFTVSGISTGVSVSNYQFYRYCTLYDGIIAMLSSVGYKLKIECKYDDNDLIVELSATPIVDYSDDIEFSQDSNVRFKIKQYTNKYNYLLALGKGELTEREVIYLSWNDGEPVVVSSIPRGDGVKVYLYDNSGSEELLKDSISKFKEINTEDTYSMTIRDNLDIDIGDIVGGRDYITGIVIAQPVTKKIIKIANESQSISYEIGGNE